VINVLGNKIYNLDGSIAGRVIDVFFNSEGKITFVRLARTIIPLINVAIQRKFIPFDLIKFMDMKYVIVVPLDMVKPFRRTSTTPSIENLLEKLERRYRLFDILVTGLLISLITLLAIISIIFKNVESLVILTIMTLLMVAPTLLRGLWEITIPNNYSFQSTLGSRVFDKQNILIGIIKKIEIDFSKGVIKDINIKRPSTIKSKHIDKLYERCEIIKIPMDIIKIARKGRIELKTGINNLIEIVKRYGCKVYKEMI